MVIRAENVGGELGAQSLSFSFQVGVLCVKFGQLVARMSVAGGGLGGDFGVGGFFFVDGAFGSLDLFHERQRPVFEFAFAARKHFFVAVEVGQFFGVGDASTVEPFIDLVEFVCQAAGFQFERAQFGYEFSGALRVAFDGGAGAFERRDICEFCFKRIAQFGVLVASRIQVLKFRQEGSLIHANGNSLNFARASDIGGEDLLT